jgi:hypothetical protein
MASALAGVLRRSDSMKKPPCWKAPAFGACPAELVSKPEWVYLFCMVDTPDPLGIAAPIALRVAWAVFDAHHTIAQHRVLPWIWFPVQLGLIAWLLVSMRGLDWGTLTFCGGFFVLIAFYATWLLAWSVRLPALYHRDFVLPRLERARREKDSRE